MFVFVTATPAATGPAPLQGAWPVCENATQSYCVEDFSNNGNSVFGPSEFSYAAAAGLRFEVHFSDADTVRWAVTGPAGEALPAALVGSFLQLRLRTGTFAVAFTQATAERFYARTDGDPANGYRLLLEGVPVEVNWQRNLDGDCTVDDCGNPLLQADMREWRFSGSSSTLPAPAQTSGTLSGSYIASNAQAASGPPTIASLDPASWEVRLANPHLTMQGNPAQGSLSVYLPADYFARLGSNADTAIAAGLGLVLAKNATHSVLRAAITSIDDGAYVRVPALTYSKVSLQGTFGAAPTSTEQAPDAPILTAASVYPGTVELAFLPPRFNGGAPITGYQAYCRQGTDATMVNLAAGARNASVSGLRGLGEASCGVKAVNRAGASASSNTKTGTPPLPRAPTAPRDVHLETELQGVSLTFNPPTSDGGSPLTGYSAQCWQGSNHVHGVHIAPDALHEIIASFESKDPVSCVVAALNAVGQSAPTQPVAAVPGVADTGEEGNNADGVAVANGVYVKQHGARRSKKQLRRTACASSKKCLRKVPLRNLNKRAGTRVHKLTHLATLPQPRR